MSTNKKMMKKKFLESAESYPKKISSNRSKILNNKKIASGVSAPKSPTGDLAVSGRIHENTNFLALRSS